MRDTLNVVELFAGVGGFRLGLEKADAKVFKTVWANQWEPSRKAQEAFDCYKKNFGGEPSNVDIATVPNELFSKLNIDLLVGGFPCQDYSVARSLSGKRAYKAKRECCFGKLSE